MQCRCPRRFCNSWIITCRPERSRQPKPSSMMTLSIGRCCLLAYWPMPSASATDTRNRWLPLRKATLIAAPPVTRLEHASSSALSVPTSAALGEGVGLLFQPGDLGAERIEPTAGGLELRVPGVRVGGGEGVELVLPLRPLGEPRVLDRLLPRGGKRPLRPLDGLMARRA